MARSVTIRTASRLHFGMFSFGHSDQAQFGGVGMMVEPPAIEVTFELAKQFEVLGTLRDRAEEFVDLALRAWGIAERPHCLVRVEEARDHVGLGVGTQLGLAVGTGLRRFLDLPPLPVGELAANLQRARRSSVGSYGFEMGGLIVDAGKLPGDAMGRLAHRTAVPSAWRFVLVTPSETRGLAGESERDAFARLPPVPQATTEALWGVVETEMLAALRRADCEAFGTAVYRFGRLAGECFSPIQGGPFANERTVRIIDAIRDAGVVGAGQSSWGPTVFAATSSVAAASALAQKLMASGVAREEEVAIAAPRNEGASVESG